MGPAILLLNVFGKERPHRNAFASCRPKAPTVSSCFQTHLNFLGNHPLKLIFSPRTHLNLFFTKFQVCPKC